MLYMITIIVLKFSPSFFERIINEPKLLTKLKQFQNNKHASLSYWTRPVLITEGKTKTILTSAQRCIVAFFVIGDLQQLRQGTVEPELGGNHASTG